MKNKLLIGVLLVIAIYLLITQTNTTGPNNDSPLFSIVQQPNMMEIPTDMQCSVQQDCLDQILALDPEADLTLKNTKCNSGTCTILIEEGLVEVAE